MDLRNLEELKNCNELDILYKIIEISENIKPRTESVLHNVREAGVDVRKAMQDIRLLSYIIRDQISIREKNKKNKPLKKDSAIDKAIALEKNRLLKEDEKIKRLEEKRKKK